jgi:hypothetical protein
MLFLLGDSPASELYGTVFPKRQYVKFRRWGITQKKGRDKTLFSISNFRLVVSVVSFG